MIRIIYKYKIDIGNAIITKLNLPVNSTVLKIDTQGNAVVMWVLQDKETTLTEERVFISYYTGREFSLNTDEETLCYIDTVTQDFLSYHIFELVK